MRSSVRVASARSLYGALPLSYGRDARTSHNSPPDGIRTRNHRLFKRVYAHAVGHGRAQPTECLRRVSGFTFHVFTIDLTGGSCGAYESRKQCELRPGYNSRQSGRSELNRYLRALSRAAFLPVCMLVPLGTIRTSRRMRSTCRTNRPPPVPRADRTSRKSASLRGPSRA